MRAVGGDEMQRDAALGFLREKVPRNWADFCDSVTDNFRVINPKDFRVLA